jgi:hypothetical protein
MRVRKLLGAAAIISGCLTACSKPAPQGGRVGRDLDLAAPPAADTAFVSAIEAGKTAPPSPINQTAHRASASSTSLAHRMAKGEQPVMTVPKALPMQGSATLSLVTAPEQVPGATPPAVQPEADTQSGMSDNGNGYQGLGAHRGGEPVQHRDPVIIIRGGMGGIDDRCDLRPRGGRGGILINRMTPPMGGGGIR